MTMQEFEDLKLHPSLTPERVWEAAMRQQTSLDNPGFCVACGEEDDSCDPDSTRGECEFCEQRTVYGVLEILMRIA